MILTEIENVYVSYVEFMIQNANDYHILDFFPQKGKLPDNSSLFPDIIDFNSFSHGGLYFNNGCIASSS